MSQDFHLVQMCPNLNRLLPWAQRQGLIPDRGRGDLGYAFHAALRAAFADVAPQPFCFLTGQGLLAYTTEADAMQAAAALANPEVADMLGLDVTSQSPGLLIRPFPARWNVGQVLSFEVRVRPIMRNDDKELDAFLVALGRPPAAGLSREAVYGEWLKRQFAAAANLFDVRMTEFKLSPVVRRGALREDGARVKRSVQGPDVVMSGRLEVCDTEAFAALLSRGVGRHRAFGFGMLLLKPIASARG